MAEDKPRGMATSMAIVVVNRVPLIKGQMPKCFWANKGVHWVSRKKSANETF